MNIKRLAWSDPNKTAAYFMRARYYDPEVGRFINKDPIGYRGGINLFTYARNNPVNFIDANGKISGADLEAALTVLELGHISGELAEAIMAEGKGDYDYYMAAECHQPFFYVHIIHWENVNWKEVNQGNFEDTIKYLMELIEKEHIK